MNRLMRKTKDELVDEVEYLRGELYRTRLERDVVARTVQDVLHGSVIDEAGNRDDNGMMSPRPVTHGLVEEWRQQLMKLSTNSFPDSEGNYHG